MATGQRQGQHTAKGSEKPPATHDKHAASVIHMFILTPFTIALRLAQATDYSSLTTLPLRPRFTSYDLRTAAPMHHSTATALSDRIAPEDRDSGNCSRGQPLGG